MDAASLLVNGEEEGTPHHGFFFFFFGNLKIGIWTWEHQISKSVLSEERA
jgi:hypothetical protein